MGLIINFKDGNDNLEFENSNEKPRQNLKLKKRTEGKIKGCLTLRDMYKKYKSEYPEDKVDYKTYSKIIKASNKKMIEKITNESESIILPYRLGELTVRKFKRSYNKPINKLAVNWKLTKEHGFKIFHEDPYLYKWYWVKSRAIVKNKTGYKFTACRFAAREVPKALNNNKEFF